MSGFEFAGLVLAMPGIIDLCIKTSESLLAKINQYKDASNLAQINKFTVQLVQGELRDLMGFFHSISATLSPLFKDELEKMFQILAVSLENALRLFRDVDGTRFKRLKFAFRDLKRIQEACSELEQWQDRFLKRAIVFLFFGGSGYPLEMRKKSPMLERIHSIRSAIAAGPETKSENPTLIRQALGSPSEARHRLPHSPLWVVQVPGATQKPNTDCVLVEYREYSDDTDKRAINALRATVRDVAHKLWEADADTMSILPCTGFAADVLQNRFELHFRIPAGKENPRSLRDILLDPINRDRGIAHSLDERINLAKKIASAVFYVHSADFVHKNVRTDNIIILEPITDPESPSKKYRQFPRAIGEPYLVGYDGVRKVDAETKRLPVGEQGKRIYLHPDRHRLAVGDEYRMKHDVYSLGVVLLEVAIWKSFVDAKGNVTEKHLKTAKGDLLPPNDLQRVFVAMAQSQIPRYLGAKYKDAVVACLKGLEEEEENHLLDDRDGIVVGLAYITQVLGKLEEISL
ncbi:hypothetical protein BDD12DRAFT_882701 [Trichophaea hybrida]|nr:hypothetical protein BDD12DRAFT_882701 [Trichophaea hybrida]